MRKPWRRETLKTERASEAVPVPIVSDALIASRGIGEGRMIPLVILDTSERLDIDELVRAHQEHAPGDTSTIWARRSRWSEVLLLLFRFERPVRCTVLLEFQPDRLGIVVDQAVRSQAIYLQPGRPGDRLMNTPDNPRILAEVPSSGFAAEWNRMYHAALAKDFRRRGLSRKAAKRASIEAIESMRMFGSRRVPPR
jgi:hypothetical protein